MHTFIFIEWHFYLCFSLSPEGLLHLHHRLLLLQLLLVGLLQDRPHPLLRLEVLGHAPVRARHLAQGQIGLPVLA